MQTNKKLPINRNNLWLSEECLDFWENMGMDYVEQQINQTVILFQIDRILTNTDDLYGETMGSNSIKYKTPVELHCRYSIEATANKAYLNSNNSARYKQTGNIKIHIYNKTLKEHECDVNYGDIIGVPINETTMLYFEVFDDGKRNFSNRNTLWGTKPMWTTIEACEIDENVANF